jgi:hypothetical protein
VWPSQHLHASGLPLYPRGPAPTGLCCPGLLRLTGPIRPTRRRIPTSPLRGLYEMPSLCRVTIGLGDPRVVLSFHWWSFATCHPLRPRGTFRLHLPSTSPETLAFDMGPTSRHSLHPHTPIPVRGRFRGLTTVRLRYDLLLGLPSLSEQTGFTSSPRGRLLLGFRRVGRPRRRRISLQCQLGNCTGGTFTR